MKRLRRWLSAVRLAHAKRTWPGYQKRYDGFDAEVLLCPGHEWIIEDRRTWRQKKGLDWNLCVVCRLCKTFRCGNRKDSNPCLEPRHHALVPHRLLDGTKYPVSMNPTDSADEGWHLNEVLEKRRKHD